MLKRSNPWLTAPNAAGLSSYAEDNIAEAELTLGSRQGSLTDVSDSPDALQANAAVESFFRLSPRTVVFGAMSYDNFSGDDMVGSAFIDPSRKPFDIVEDSLTNAGRKHRDTYHLTGAVAFTVADGFAVGTRRTVPDGFAVGTRLDYTAANYAKYKDLRHKNKLMDLTFTAGFTLTSPLGPRGRLPKQELSTLNSLITLGANYLYRRTTESLDFGTYGKGDRVYKSLISYGPYVGFVEQFGTTGYTDKSREMPLVDSYNGLGLQLSIHHGPLTFYNQLSLTHRTGYYGNHSPYTITYTAHSSNLTAYQASLALQSRGSRFTLDLSLSSENLENHANNYLERQNDNAASYYEYYTPVKTANRLWRDGSLTATADLAVSGQLPTWTLQAAANWHRRRQTAYLYPYYRRQDLTTTELTATATRRLIYKKGVWTLTATAAFQQGSGEPYEDQTFATPSDKQTPPATMDDYLYQEYHWLTAPQYAVNASVQYAFRWPGTHVLPHIRVAAGHRKANTAPRTGYHRDRTTLDVGVGCTF